MPVHDWTRVDDGIFHAFHLAWLGELQKALNRGILRAGYYALAEQIAGSARQRKLVIHHVSGDRIVAVLEIVSTGSKASNHAIRTFIEKAIGVLTHGYNLLLVDLYSPAPRPARHSRRDLGRTGRPAVHPAGRAATDGGLL
jgi:hypothetical protein